MLKGLLLSFAILFCLAGISGFGAGAASVDRIAVSRTAYTHEKRAGANP